MTTNNVFYCDDFEETKGYKYIASIKESDSSYSQLYASNNLRELKSFVYNDVRQSFDTASGSIHKSSDEYFNYPIYMCWNEGSKTYCQNLSY